MEEFEKAVGLLEAVLIKFKAEYYIDPKPFLNTLIKYFGSAEHKMKSEGFNEAVCRKVFEDLYPATSPPPVQRLT